MSGSWIVTSFYNERRSMYVFLNFRNMSQYIELSWVSSVAVHQQTIVSINWIDTKTDLNSSLDSKPCQPTKNHIIRFLTQLHCTNVIELHCTDVIELYCIDMIELYCTDWLSCTVQIWLSYTVQMWLSCTVSSSLIL